MMFSATDFLPDSIRVLTNLATSTLPNFGSGRISRLGTSRRRGISIPFDLQLSCSAIFAARPRPAMQTDHLLDPLGADTCSTGLRRKFDYFLPDLARLAPYFERACLRSLTPWVSSAPRTMW